MNSTYRRRLGWKITVNTNSLSTIQIEEDNTSDTLKQNSNGQSTEPNAAFSWKKKEIAGLRNMRPRSKICEK